MERGIVDSPANTCNVGEGDWCKSAKRQQLIKMASVDEDDRRRRLLSLRHFVVLDIIDLSSGIVELCMVV